MKGEELRQLRHQAGATQLGLAQYLGVSQTTIHDIEAGYRQAGPELVERIREVLSNGIPKSMRRQRNLCQTIGQGQVKPAGGLQRSFYVCGNCMQTYTDSHARELCCKKELKVTRVRFWPGGE